MGVYSEKGGGKRKRVRGENRKERRKGERKIDRGSLSERKVRVKREKKRVEGKTRKGVYVNVRRRQESKRG